tara:strand:+ start:4714 stop:6159 length:1446 start_codon:yes stop_codon:yes gene_type:complete
MEFFQFEERMKAKGFSTLAEIARVLETTPQAVNNWKSRNQVPSHVLVKMQFHQNIFSKEEVKSNIPFESIPKEKEIKFSDILISISSQIKVILFITFLSVFLSFTYINLIEEPKYESWATVLLPDVSKNSSTGIAGIASQFGVNLNQEINTDLSSPSLYPEIIKSRVFAKKVIYKTFYTGKYQKELPLIGIITNETDQSLFYSDSLFQIGVKELNENYIEFDQDPKSAISVIKISTFEPSFSQKLANVVILELEKLNRFYKSVTVNEKIDFIENRINSVQENLETSENKLKNFNEKNRQVNSPHLKLELDKLERDLEVEKEVYMTLKQQLELAKIEAIQESSIVQILDEPHLPLLPSNKNQIQSFLLSVILGFLLGVFAGFIRTYIHNNDTSERKKIRKVRNFFKKKLKDTFYDHRFLGLVSLILILFLPLYLFQNNQNPVYFNKYSEKMFLVILTYLLFLSIFSVLYVNRYRVNKKKMRY